jgi:HK97 gp10 family phage protein
VLAGVQVALDLVQDALSPKGDTPVPFKIVTWFSKKAATMSNKAKYAAAEAAGEYIAIRARANAPSKTGKLRAAIKRGPVTQTNTQTRVTVSVGEEAMPYGAYQEFGTGIYLPGGKPITPKRGKYMVWETMGKAYQGRYVRNRMVASGIRVGRRRTVAAPERNIYLHFATQVKGTPPVRYMQRATTDGRTTQFILKTCEKIGVEISTNLVTPGGR